MYFFEFFFVFVLVNYLFFHLALVIVRTSINIKSCPHCSKDLSTVRQDNAKVQGDSDLYIINDLVI